MMLKRLSHVFFFLFFVIIGLIAPFAYKTWLIKKESTPFIPHVQEVTLQPPSEALTGQIASLRGDVKKRPRASSSAELVLVQPRESLLQGERFVVGSDSQTLVLFPRFLNLIVEAGTDMTLFSASPQNFLIKQDSGTLRFEPASNLPDQPPFASINFSVRSLRTLISFADAVAQVTVDPKLQIITVEVNSGQATAALVGKDNNTQVATAAAQQKLIIRDKQATMQVEPLPKEDYPEGY
jgi:hypothetical protein